MRAIAGLGNPEARYARTRHNAGWMLLDLMAERGKLLERREREWVQLEKRKLGPDAIWLIRSKTYMNNSGLGLQQACRSLQLQPGELVVAYDDVDLSLGQLRLRQSGGAGGHRGLESVIESLGTPRIPRLRLGIRGESPWRDTADYVLSEFQQDEVDLLAAMLQRAADAVRMIVHRGLGAAMNTYNQKSKPKNGSEASATTPDKEQRE